MSESKAAPLIAIVSQIVRTAGPQGITATQVGEQIKKHFPQFKASSSSPALSNLCVVDCVRFENKWGTRYYFHVADYTEAKHERLRQREKEMREIAEKEGKKRTSPSGAVAVDSSLRMLIAIGKDHTETLTFAQAKDLYLQLHAIFGRKE